MSYKICLENRFAIKKIIKSLSEDANVNVSEGTVRRKPKNLGLKSKLTAGKQSGVLIKMRTSGDR